MEASRDLYDNDLDVSSLSDPDEFFDDFNPDYVDAESSEEPVDEEIQILLKGVTFAPEFEEPSQDQPESQLARIRRARYEREERERKERLREPTEPQLSQEYIPREGIESRLPDMSSESRSRMSRRNQRLLKPARGVDLNTAIYRDVRIAEGATRSDVIEAPIDYPTLPSRAHGSVPVIEMDIDDIDPTFDVDALLASGPWIEMSIPDTRKNIAESEVLTLSNTKPASAPYKIFKPATSGRVKSLASTRHQSVDRLLDRPVSESLRLFMRGYLHNVFDGLYRKGEPAGIEPLADLAMMKLYPYNKSNIVDFMVGDRTVYTLQWTYNSKLYMRVYESYDQASSDHRFIRTYVFATFAYYLATVLLDKDDTYTDIYRAVERKNLGTRQLTQVTSARHYLRTIVKKITHKRLSKTSLWEPFMASEIWIRASNEYAIHARRASQLSQLDYVIYGDRMETTSEKIYRLESMIGKSKIGTALQTMDPKKYLKMLKRAAIPLEPTIAERLKSETDVIIAIRLLEQSNGKERLDAYKEAHPKKYIDALALIVEKTIDSIKIDPNRLLDESFDTDTYRQFIRVLDQQILAIESRIFTTTRTAYQYLKQLARPLIFTSNLSIINRYSRHVQTKFQTGELTLLDIMDLPLHEYFPEFYLGVTDSTILAAGTREIESEIDISAQLLMERFIVVDQITAPMQSRIKRYTRFKWNRYIRDTGDVVRECTMKHCGKTIQIGQEELPSDMNDILIGRDGNEFVCYPREKVIRAVYDNKNVSDKVADPCREGKYLAPELVQRIRRDMMI